MGKTKIVLDLQSDLILNDALIVRPSGIVKSDLPGLVEDIQGITMSIADEASARAAGDQQLASDLADLQNYVDTTVDSAIATLTSDLADETAARIADVDDEEARALAAEAQLSSDLADLQTYVDTTVDSAIATLTSDLADETAARIADVDAEEARALAAEGVLQSNIDTQAGRIDAILDGSSVNLDQFKEVVDFVESIDLANDNSLLAVVTQINSDIDAEEAARIAGDAQLSSDLANLQSYVDTTVDSAIATLTSDLADETARATAAEQALDDAKLDLAGGTMTGHIDMGGNNIDGINQLTKSSDAPFIQVNSETNFQGNPLTGVGGIALNSNGTVTNVPTPTNGTDVVNKDYVDSAINGSNVDLSGEIAARIAGDSYLQSEIDALALTDGETIDVDYAANTIRLKEVVAAPDSGVRTFEGDIKVATQPDQLPSYNDSSLITKGILDSRLSNEVSTLNTTISNEVARAEAAESQLQSNIDTERNRIDAILLASDADKDSFAEIVQLINSVDTENDTAFASYVLSNDARLTAEEQERLRLTNLLGDGLVNEQIAREDGDAALQHEFDILPMTDGETIELNYVDNTIRLKEFVNMPDSGVRVFEGDVKADSQPENRSTFNELSYVTKNYVDNKVYNDLSDAVQQEMAERIAADAALTELIDVKKSEAIATSNEYTDVETQRALSAEGSLRSSIDTLALTDGDTIDVNYADNTIRLKEVVAAPDSGVRTFEGDIKVGEQPSSLSSYNDYSLITKGIMDTRLSEEVGDINTSINDEISRAQAAESQLQSNIDVEKGRIDAILSASDADKDSFAEIVQLINSVDTENDQAFASYVLSNDAALAAEIAERLRLTNLLGDGIVNEQIAREDADAAIHYELDHLPMTDGETIDVNYVDNTIKLKDTVAAPESGYRVFEGDLKLNAQPDTNPNFNDLSLITKYYVDNKVSTDLTNAIAQEEADRIAADAGLMADINSEIQRALGVEAELLAAIDAEVLARIAADSELDGRINDIVSNSNAPIIDSFTEVVGQLDSLRSDLIEETDSRAIAEAALQAAIDAETAARLAADSELDGRINDIISNTNAPIIDSFAEVVAQMESMPGVDDSSIVVDAENNISLKDTISAPASGARTFEGLVNVGSEPSLDANFVDLSLVTKGYVSGLIDAEAAARIAADSELDGRIIDIISNTNAPIIDSFAEVVAQMESMPGVDDSSIVVDAENNISLKETVAAPASGVRTFGGLVNVGSEPSLDAKFVDLSLVTKGYVTGLVSTEEAARIAGDAQLSSDLATETAARIADVDAEEARALAAEASLSATFSAAISAEVARATAAEGVLQSNIDVEKGRIDAILLASDADKDSFAEIVSLINSVDTENDQAFASYVLSNNAALVSLSATFSTAISNETAARIADVDAEEARALAAEAALSSDLVDLQNYVDTTVDSAIATLTSDLATETAARIADVDAEETRALAAEAVLQTNINTEANERMAEDITLQGNIDIEATRAQAAETAIATDLATEITDRIAAVSAEETRAMLAESALSATFSAAISAEVARATAAEGVLQSNIDVEKSRIDSILLASDADKDSFAEIVQLINSVDTTNDQAFASYVLSNDTALASEVSRATAAESALSATFSAAISSEVSRATAAELVLTNDLASEVSRATAAESALTAALSAEETSRIAGDSALQSSLNNEISDRLAADQALQSALDSESTRALAAEGVLTSDLAAEVARATAAEASLSATFSSSLAAEVFRATAAEIQLQNELSDETSYRIDADTLLQSNIDVEKGRIDAILLASDADKDSFAEIVSLINSVDTTNDQAFASYVLSNDAALAAEVSRATAAEASLSATFSAAISAEVARATAAEAALAADFANIYCKKVSVSGTPNGVLTSFALASPVRLGSEMIYLNGLLMEEGEDYTTVLTAGKVTSVTFSSAPTSVMKLVAYGVY
jgi:predicted small integral membrane protein